MKDVVAISDKPRLVEGSLGLDENGHVKLHGGGRTSVPDVFAAGDCADHVYRQALRPRGWTSPQPIDAERFLATQESQLQLAAA